jgi:hypothetical protein
MRKKQSQIWSTTLALPIALALLVMSACGETPAEPAALERAASAESAAFQNHRRPGTGLVLDNLTGVTVPVLGIDLGEVIIDQAIITDLKLVEDITGAIIGVEAEGVLQLTGGVLGTDVVTQDFTTILGIASTESGRCDIVGVDLGPISVDVLDPLARVDVPAAEVTVRGSGAVASVLCALGRALGGVSRAVEGLVRAVNNLI